MPDKSSGKKKSKKEAESAPVPLTEDDREFYTLQIQALKEQVQRCEHKCSELELRKKDLSSKNDFMLKEKEDILISMKCSLDKKDEQISDLLTKLLALQTAIETERESYEMQLSSLQQELQKNMNKLISENKNLEMRMERVCKQKDDHLAEVVASLTGQLNKERQEHEAAVQDLETKAELERNRLKTQMEVSLADATAKYNNLLEIKVEQQKNVDNYKELERKNATLIATVKQLKKELSISEDLMKETTKKNVEYLKILEQMKHSCQVKNTQLKELANQKKHHLKLLAEHTELQKKYEELRQKNQSDVERLTQKETCEEKLKQQAKTEKEKREYMEAVLFKLVTMMGNFKPQASTQYRT